MEKNQKTAFGFFKTMCIEMATPAIACAYFKYNAKLEIKQTKKTCMISLYSPVLAIPCILSPLCILRVMGTGEIKVGREDKTDGAGKTTGDMKEKNELGRGAQETVKEE